MKTTNYKCDNCGEAITNIENTMHILELHISLLRIVEGEQNMLKYKKNFKLEFCNLDCADEFVTTLTDEPTKLKNKKKVEP